MTDTTAVESKKVEALFLQVADLPPNEARGALDRACVGRPDIRAAVERLLLRDREAPPRFLIANGGPSPVTDGIPGESARIGRFRVLRRLANGGMGVVFVAYDETLERRVAIKLLHRELASPEWLRREAVALARLSHENVVPVHEIGEEEGRGFVVMDLVEGPTLKDWLASARRSAHEILGVFLQAARGLEAAHAAGLVHRDFKPQNVLIGKDGRAQVVDFGLASIGERAVEVGVVTPASPSGHSGPMAGTPGFMSPEQILGEGVTAKSDQFSYCVSLYDALYGSPPFEGSGPTLADHVLAGKAKPPPASSESPAWIAPIVMRGLARLPEARFDSMKALIAAIERHRSPHPDFDPTATRRGRRIVASILLMSGVCLGTVVGLREPTKHLTNVDVVRVAAALLVLACVSLVAFRHRLANAFGRRFAGVLVVVLAAVLAHRLACLRFGMPIEHILPVDLLFLGAEMMITAITFHRALAWTGVVFFVGAAIAVAWPPLAIAAMVGAGLGGTATLFWTLAD
jgi:eukaryotic-like serine/threonine-protein kinase